MFKNDKEIEEKKEQEVSKKSKNGSKKIVPLKDFVIRHNDIHLELKEGEEIEVPAIFLDNLKTEKVI